MILDPACVLAAMSKIVIEARAANNTRAVFMTVSPLKVFAASHGLTPCSVLEITFPDSAGAAGGLHWGAPPHPLERPRPLRYAVEAAQLPRIVDMEQRLRAVGRA
jgi:hypothetical protein